MALFIQQKKISTFTNGIGLLLLFSILLNAIAVGWQLRYLMRGSPSYSYVGADTPRELPIKVRKANMVFSDDPQHYALTGSAASAEWNALRPLGEGYVYLSGSERPFEVSMWHQLRCLDRIRKALVSGDDGSGQIEHCFHYLRQGILCGADITLEPVAAGTNVTHTCRNWKQVYGYLEEEHERWTDDMVARVQMSLD